jgi:hypothetical protein
LGDARHAFRDFVEGIVPIDGLELAAALGALAPQRMQQPIGMFKPLAIACHFGAHHSERVAVVARSRDPPNAAIGQHGHLERTGAWTIVWASGLAEALHEIWHTVSLARAAAGRCTSLPLAI